MLFTTITSLAALALAGQAAAEPIRQPYKLKLSRMPVDSLFGLSRRQTDGYAPEQQFCGAGDTCAQACGKGFEQCSSNDGLVHCFNKSAKQTCCPGSTGDSCDKGYFCSADEKGATWCCPDSMTLKECAAAYNLPGPLVSETEPAPSTTSPAPAGATTVKVIHTTTAVYTPGVTTTSESTQTSIVDSTPSPTANAAPAASTTSSASATPTAPSNGMVEAGSDSLHISAGGVVVLAAAAFAALL
ncbi:hypothetical protein GGR52DRAFT_443155 [Hypoxylon sp. FL1284]|nr:hypothetical protein GGR52DRAFT_443155 [Hypoxylon sp. FL1284]